ncbi:MAG: hypothetical protein JJ891_11955 [Rhizobiaceae bacterium]|jgi:hypothetical protein|nr:hypothetical protein [Rhizobiaceae bacterium]
MALAACQTGSPSADLSINTKSPPQDIVTSLAKAAQKCWFKSGDTAFRGYRLAAEVNSYAGRPRFLLVPKKDPSGLPSLVVQAEVRGDQGSGKFTNVQTFGPLLASNEGSRITGDIKRWSNGSASCSA